MTEEELKALLENAALSEEPHPVRTAMPITAHRPAVSTMRSPLFSFLFIIFSSSFLLNCCDKFFSFLLTAIA